MAFVRALRLAQRRLLTGHIENVVDDLEEDAQLRCEAAVGNCGRGCDGRPNKYALDRRGDQRAGLQLVQVTQLDRGAAGVHGMVGGQYLDVSGDPAVELRHLHELKTGALIAASVDSVLALEGMSGPATIPFRRFAAELGVVFQIVDDILDVTGDEAEIGKPRGSDERHGKATYVSVHGLERARELARASHSKARAALADAEGDTARLGQIADYILTRTT